MSRRGRNPYRWQNPSVGGGRGKFESSNKTFSQSSPLRGRPPRTSRGGGFSRRGRNYDDDQHYSREWRERDAHSSTNRFREPANRDHSSSSDRYDKGPFDSFQHHDLRHDRYDYDIVKDRTIDRSDFFGGKFPNPGRPHLDKYIDRPSEDRLPERNRLPEDERERRHFYIEDKYPKTKQPHIESIDYKHRHKNDNNFNEYDNVEYRERSFQNYSKPHNDYDDFSRYKQSQTYGSPNIYEQELQRRDNENQDRMKNVLLEHLRPTEEEKVEETSQIDFEEVTKILNNPSLKQLLKKVSIESEQKSNREEISLTNNDKNPISSITAEDEEKFLYGFSDNEHKSSSLDDEIIHKLNKTKKYKRHKTSHEKKSKKRKRSREHSRTRSTSRSRERSKHASTTRAVSSKRHSRDRSSDHATRSSSSKRHNSNDRSKNIEKFLLNAADAVVKNNLNVPVYFNPPPFFTHFPPKNANIVALQAPMLPMQPPVPTKFHNQNKSLNNQLVDSNTRGRSNSKSLRTASPPSRSANHHRDKKPSSHHRDKKSSSHHRDKKSSSHHDKKSSSHHDKKSSSHHDKKSSRHHDKKSSSHQYPRISNSSITLTEMISNAKHESRKSSKSHNASKNTAREITSKYPTQTPALSKKRVKPLNETEKKPKYKPWYNELCRRIEQRRRRKQRLLTKAKSFPKNARQIDIARECLRQVTRHYTHTLRQAKAEYFKKMEGDTEVFCSLVLSDIIDKICTHERKGTKDEDRIKSLNKKYNLKLPLNAEHGSLPTIENAENIPFGNQNERFENVNSSVSNDDANNVKDVISHKPCSKSSKNLSKDGNNDSKEENDVDDNSEYSEDADENSDVEESDNENSEHSDADENNSDGDENNSGGDENDSDADENDFDDDENDFDADENDSENDSDGDEHKFDVNDENDENLSDNNLEEPDNDKCERLEDNSSDTKTDNDNLEGDKNSVSDEDNESVTSSNQDDVTEESSSSEIDATNDIEIVEIESDDNDEPNNPKSLNDVPMSAKNISENFSAVKSETADSVEKAEINHPVILPDSNQNAVFASDNKQVSENAVITISEEEDSHHVSSSDERENVNEVLSDSHNSDHDKSEIRGSPNITGINDDSKNLNKKILSYENKGVIEID